MLPIVTPNIIYPWYYLLGTYNIISDNLSTNCDNLFEELQYEQIELTNKIENEKWLEAEKLAIEKWNKLQQRTILMLEQKLEQEAKLKLVCIQYPNILTSTVVSPKNTLSILELHQICV